MGNKGSKRRLSADDLPGVRGDGVQVVSVNRLPVDLTDLDGEYAVECRSAGSAALLGAGQYGAVVQGLRKSDHKRVAIKVLKTSCAPDRETRERVHSEMDLMRQVQQSGAGTDGHPNLLSLMAADRRHLYLVLELCDGSDLAALIDRDGSGRFDDEIAQLLIG